MKCPHCHASYDGSDDQTCPSCGWHPSDNLSPEAKAAKVRSEPLFTPSEAAPFAKTAIEFLKRALRDGFDATVQAELRHPSSPDPDWAATMLAIASETPFPALSSYDPDAPTYACFHCRDTGFVCSDRAATQTYGPRHQETVAYSRRCSCQATAPRKWHEPEKPRDVPI